MKKKAVNVSSRHFGVILYTHICGYLLRLFSVDLPFFFLNSAGRTCFTMLSLVIAHHICIRNTLWIVIVWYFCTRSAYERRVTQQYSVQSGQNWWKPKWNDNNFTASVGYFSQKLYILEDWCAKWLFEQWQTGHGSRSYEPNIALCNRDRELAVVPFDEGHGAVEYGRNMAGKIIKKCHRQY